MSHATEYEDGLNSSDGMVLSENYQEINEDPFERVRCKLQGWRGEDKSIESSYQFGEDIDGKITKVSHLLADNKENFETVLSTSTPEFEVSSSMVNKKLIDELSRRNEIYTLAKQNLRAEPSYYKK
jgi:hypothetical protein